MAPQPWGRPAERLDGQSCQPPGAPGGPQATAALEALIPVGSGVYLEADREDTDRYGRFLRYLYTDDGMFVNLQMVRAGHSEAVLRGGGEKTRL